MVLHHYCQQHLFLQENHHVLVNRYWCQNTIPYLWSSPFSNRRKIHKIIPLYMTFLSDDRLDELYQKGVPKIPKNICLFDYPLLLQNLDIQLLSWAIYNWLKFEILKIKKGKIQDHKKIIYGDDDDDDAEIYYYDNNNRNENYGFLDVKMFIKLFSELCRIFLIKSTKIFKLNETFESELKFLISRQRNLNKIIARNCNFEKSIFKSLMDYCNNSLSVLEFYNFRFEPMSLDLLRQCKNLKILKLEFVKYNGSKELYRLLGQIKFLKLKNLSLKLIDYETSYDAQYNFGPTIEEFYEIFKTNGLNLNILKLEINFEKYSEALSIIGKNCKNLKEVEVIGNYDVKDLLIFLNQPLNLKKLSLGSSDIDPIEILLQIPNLIAIKKLSYFYTNWVFYTSEILNILNNWEAPCLEFSYWCAENLLELHEK
ncbi:2615_t:CDS:2, partial [Entrophospora sp. SA101]